MVERVMPVQGINFPPHSWADINLGALRHNFQRARRAAPGSRLCPVIKANGYGHGVLPVAKTLYPLLAEGEAVAVVTLTEALSLRQAIADLPVLTMRGALNRAEMQSLLENGLYFVIHSPWQAELLAEALADGARPENKQLNIWVKVNSGMNRLGMSAEAAQQVWPKLAALAEKYELQCHRVLMSHLATADDTGGPLTSRQVQAFNHLADVLGMSANEDRSLAASAGILSWPETHQSIARPGIMLYGASPMIGCTGPDDDLQPVMNLKSRIIAVNEVQAGDTVGYGATYHCQEDKRIGVIGIGYGDGYPRHAPSGTPVLIHSGGKVYERALAGRVSMDMLTVDLGDAPIQVGDEVLLWGHAWGADLPANRIADLCGTIAYELFCQITSRVQFNYR